jgi:hypothetical protein
MNSYPLHDAPPLLLLDATLQLHAAAAARFAGMSLHHDRGELAGVADVFHDAESVYAGGHDLRWPGVDRPVAMMMAALDACLAAGVDRRVLEEILTGCGCTYEEALTTAQRHGTTLRMARFHSDPDDYHWVALRDLPHAHNPRVRKAEFQAALGMPRWRRSLLARGPWARQRAAGRVWLQRLPADAIGPDSRRDLPDVAAVLPAVRQALDVRPFTEEHVRACLATLVTDPDARRLAVSFFVEPITWDRGDDVVSTGQHRVAAARLQRVPHVLVASS